MKIKTMFKAILSLAVCLMVVSVISVAVSAAEYEEIKMDVSVSSSATYNKYQIDIPHDGHIILYFDISCEYNYQTVITFYDSNGETICGDPYQETGEGYYWMGKYETYVNKVTEKSVGEIRYYDLPKGKYYIQLNLYASGSSEMPASGTIKISHEHSYSGTVTSESTCTKKGSIKYTCDCGDSYTEEIPLKSHNEVTDYGKAATCTETGLTDGSHCSVCKKVLVAQSEIPKTNHEYNASYKVIKDATCTEKGTIRYYCVCGKTKDEELPLTEHEAVIDKAVAATCTKEGKTQGSHCDICNKVIILQETVPKTDHIAVTDKAVASTCVNSGKTEGSHCSVCKKVLKEQETIAATGKHKLKHIAEKKATESSSAVQEHWKCSVCGQLFADEKGTIPYKQLLVKDETPLMLIIGISVGALLLIGGAVTVIILILKKKSDKNTDITGRE